MKEAPKRLWRPEEVGELFPGRDGKPTAGKTVLRWSDPQHAQYIPGFPASILLGSRRYFDPDDIAEYQRRRFEEARRV